MGTTLGLDRNIEGALCYALGWITGVLFFFLEEDRFVRFHAVQSILLFGGIYIFGLISSFLVAALTAGLGPAGSPVARLVPFVSSLLTVLVFVLWLLLMLSAYRGNRVRLPVVGDLAEKLS